MKRRLNIILFAFISIVVIVTIIYIGFNFRDLDAISIGLSMIGASAAILGYVLSSETYLKGIDNDEKEKEINHESDGKKQIAKEEQKVEQFQENLQGVEEDPTEVPQREVTRERYSYDSFVSLRRRDVILHFRNTEKRIKEEIDRLVRRANINLIIGSIIAVVGVLGLIAFILGEPDKDCETDIVFIIVHWVTRLSLVSFVEVFAIFFLKMYKSELLSIQYYQDELTSIESRKIALMFSVIHDSQEDISKAIDCLVNIDRNFKMDATQTTVDLEKLKTENSFIKAQMDSMVEIFKGALNFIPRKEG